MSPLSVAGLGAKAVLLRYTTASGLSGLCAMGLGVTREHVAEHLLCSQRTLDVPVVLMACECECAASPELGRTRFVD